MSMNEKTDHMKIYFAPLEGVTGYIFRNAYNGIYGHIDKYFAPFISPSEKCAITPKERKDIASENNEGFILFLRYLLANPTVLSMLQKNFSQWVTKK